MKLIATIGLVLVQVVLLAQSSIDLFTLSGRYAAPALYKEMPSQNARETGALVNIKLPVKFSKKTIWYNNLTYTFAGASNDMQWADNLMNPIELHAFILQTGLVQRIDKTRAFQLLFVPRFMTDFYAPSAQQMQFGAVALFEKRFSEKLMMRFGAMYNQEESGSLIVPLIDVNWRFAPKWSITGLVPIYAKINYHASQKLTLGLSHFGLITSYKLSDPAMGGNYMERTSIDLTLFARYNVFGNWHLEARAGYALGRTYAQYNADEKIDFRISIIKIGDHRPEPLNLIFEDGFIANLRLVYNLPLE